MREIIYVQAGRLANYTGTHFWNTQEKYIPYGEEDPEKSDVDFKISFSESVDDQERSTLYPRALIFDLKANFGTLGADISTEDEGETSAIWSGNLVEHRQEAIPKSAYHTFLDEGGEEHENSEENASPKSAPPVPPPVDAVRYWSDFSRVYFRSRSLQAVSSGATAEDDGSVVSWQDGQEAFRQHDKDYDVLDDALRLLVEDCDNMGAIQILSDTDTFGGFTAAFLEVFRDEYTKPLAFSFPLFPGPSAQRGEIQNTKSLLNEAFVLRALKEYSSMNVPLRDPVAYCNALGYSAESIYHRSGLVSSLVESSTLPFRLKQCSQDIVSIWSALNSRNTQFAELSGVFPYTGPSDLDSRVFNLSSTSAQNPKNVAYYAHVNVSRGFTASDITAYDRWISHTRPTQNACYIASIHAAAIPLPSSFPVPLGVSTPPPRTKQGTSTMKLYSSLSASSNFSSTLEQYAKFVDNLLRQPSASAVAGMDGITKDELQELVSDLWTMHDGFADDSLED